MRVTVQVRIEPDADDIAGVSVIDVATIERRELALDTLGLCIAEAKTLLAGVQDVVVTAQAAQAVRERERCDVCGRRFAHKDARTLVMRTLFGTIPIASPRWWSCRCGPQRVKTFSPIARLLDERSTPELRYVQTKFAGLMSYRLAGRVLDDLLPVGRTITATGLARQVAKVADRLDNELTADRFCYLDAQADADLERPGLPLVVAIDGGYIHSSEQRSRRDGWFEAIVGSVTRADGSRRRFGFVPSVDHKPKARLVELLQAQGMQANQQVTFLTDGADDVRDLTVLINENAEHILHWFHVTMRVTVINQLAKGLDNHERDVALELLQRVKRFLWHGNLYRAQQLLAWLHVDLAAGDTARHTRLVELVDNFDGYLTANARSIPNYGERYRAGEPISSAPAESIVNTMIARRMNKRQQMRWTPAGAHRVLQIRARVLDDALGDDFKRWYPNLALNDPAA